MKLDFQHIQSGHCENGVITSLLKYHNVELSEPMVFGIGSGLFFAYMPFLKLNGIPIASFRPVPGMIFSRTTKRLGIKMKIQTFRRQPEKAMRELDAVLEKKLPAGLQCGAYHLTYFPPAYRFHFNMHNIAIFGKENGEYLISDPVMEFTTKLTKEELIKVRYAKGPFSPHGKMYYPISIPEKLDLEKAIVKGINQTANWMLNIPIPLFGVKGIRYMARRIKKWPNKLGKRRASQYLAQMVRMAEEIGTGGAGFRFIYAAFLQEAAEILKKDELNNLSADMTRIGDEWRKFSSLAAQTCKGRTDVENPYDKIYELVMGIADMEEQLFKDLKKVMK